MKFLFNLQEATQTFPIQWKNLYGNTPALALAELAQQLKKPICFFISDPRRLSHMEAAIRFYYGNTDLEQLVFKDLEILPYDQFSAHEDIVSERMDTLHRLKQSFKGIVLSSIQNAFYRLPPESYFLERTFVLKKGAIVSLDSLRKQLDENHYQAVTQVLKHGEFAIRGSILDVFPMGGPVPYRIEWFDDEIESIRIFDKDTQRTTEKITSIHLLPATQVPLDEAGITHFRNQWRQFFTGNPTQNEIYPNISNGIPVPGIDNYLPLFFNETATLLDYLPRDTILCTDETIQESAQAFWKTIESRYEQRQGDLGKPPLEPSLLFESPAILFDKMSRFSRIFLGTSFDTETTLPSYTFQTKEPPQFSLAGKKTNLLSKFIEKTPELRILFCLQSISRKEQCRALLEAQSFHAKEYKNFESFLNDTSPFGILTQELFQGAWFTHPSILIATEYELFGYVSTSTSKQKTPPLSAEMILQFLDALQINDPIVHVIHGVGRYGGLATLTFDGITSEFVIILYAEGDKLYVPVASLHLIHRYNAFDDKEIPLSKLGNDQWDKSKQKAFEKIRDVAVELLAIHAKRQAQPGIRYSLDEASYKQFAASFPFEETPDQAQAIQNVLRDMQADKKMDHLVCGDVGFGKTEVAMRAAFLAVQNQRQVAFLVPTTLLAQQHFETLSLRFADWPIRIAALSRFQSSKEEKQILEQAQAGTLDILIGTHKLIQQNIPFKNLGLLIIDEEHRFGVQQKEKIKALRAEVDILTLTATPIPRTLNMALLGVRDLSLIATAPDKRLSIKTFVREFDFPLILEAIQREVMRGGQIFYIHNNVGTIEKRAQSIQEKLPHIRVMVAHGQMHEKKLEEIMLEFYHQRYHVLVCTTIIESGIDIPTANTIIIEHADRFGLAQLHQLRGRVGRSHHQAYAYLLAPPKSCLKDDALKRLSAIESLEELGSGYLLATHDLEIRGAGEFLGEQQSGHIQAIGYSLYMQMLEQAMHALREDGSLTEIDRMMHPNTEIELHIPSYIPDTYLPDINMRLILYKRMANTKQAEELDDLKNEMLDRFGTIPTPLHYLFQVTELRQTAEKLGIKRIDVTERSGRLVFTKKPHLDPYHLIQLIQGYPSIFKLQGSEKLSFSYLTETVEQRLEFVKKTLKQLEKFDKKMLF